MDFGQSYSYFINTNLKNVVDVLNILYFFFSRIKVDVKYSLKMHHRHHHQPYKYLKRIHEWVPILFLHLQIGMHFLPYLSKHISVIFIWHRTNFLISFYRVTEFIQNDESQSSLQSSTSATIEGSTKKHHRSKIEVVDPEG